MKIDASTSVLDDDGNPVEPGSGKIGQIARSGHIPIGYYKDEAKTAATFREINGVRYSIPPGDYAQVEEDGSVTMLGRGSVSINSGGEKIYPEEVEAALKSHPDVFDVLVVGVPDERWGQRVAAVIAARDGERPSAKSLADACRTLIAGYKVPRSVWYVDEIKRSPRRASPTTGGPTSRPSRVRRTTTTSTAPPSRPGRGVPAMHTDLSKKFGIDYPIFGFTPPSEHVAAAISGPGASACSDACGSTIRTSSTTRSHGWTRTPTASRTASTS